MSEIDYSRLAALVRAKQGSRGLREISAEIGAISPSTLSRLLRDEVSDMTNSTFLQICDWLGVAPDEFILEETVESSESIDISTPDKIALQLRADPDLDPTTAAMLAEMVKAAYQRARKEVGR